jgi:hypothetical protein
MLAKRARQVPFASCHPSIQHATRAIDDVPRAPLARQQRREGILFAAMPLSSFSQKGTPRTRTRHRQIMLDPGYAIRPKR